MHTKLNHTAKCSIALFVLQAAPVLFCCCSQMANTLLVGLQLILYLLTLRDFMDPDMNTTRNMLNYLYSILKRADHEVEAYMEK